jgi:hypothetical protein
MDDTTDAETSEAEGTRQECTEEAMRTSLIAIATTLAGRRRLLLCDTSAPGGA